jgi:hypothetical protein
MIREQQIENSSVAFDAWFFYSLVLQSLMIVSSRYHESKDGDSMLSWVLTRAYDMFVVR